MKIIDKLNYDFICRYMLTESSEFWKGKYQLWHRKHGSYIRHLADSKACSFKELTVADEKEISRIWGGYKRYYNHHFFVHLQNYLNYIF